MTADVELLPAPRPRRQASAVESEVLGMVIFIFTEVMFFAGLMSAFNIISATAPMWPPPGDPTLPAGATAVTTLALLASGVAVWFSGRAARPVPVLRVALVLGLAFVAWQVVEAVQLTRLGLSLVSSAHGGLFFTIVGAHAIHAVLAIGILAWASSRLSAGRLSPTMFRVVRMFWYFVTGLWPFLYYVVYLWRR